MEAGVAPGPLVVAIRGIEDAPLPCVRFQVQGSEPAWSFRVWRTWRSFVLCFVWT